MRPYLEPLRKSVSVPCSAADAFALFAGRIADWWPLASYSVYGSGARSCGVEPRVGGELFEVGPEGKRAIWGRVTRWDPPRMLAFTWFPGRTEDTAQTVEVRFIEGKKGTRVELEHRDWQTLPAGAEEIRRGYDGGWDAVLGRYRQAAGSRA